MIYEAFIFLNIASSIYLPAYLPVRAREVKMKCTHRIVAGNQLVYALVKLFRQILDLITAQPARIFLLKHCNQLKRFIL